MTREPQWTPPTEAQLTAASEMVDLIVDALRSDRGVHAETAIGAAARMAGTCLFRSFGFELRNVKPGSPVLSDAANERGPLLLQTLGTALAAAKLQSSALTLPPDIADEHRPRLSLIETQTLLEPAVRRIAARHGLTPEQAAHACTLAAARLIRMCVEVLDPRIGFAVATQGFVEGTKTAPVPLPKDSAVP